MIPEEKARPPPPRAAAAAAPPPPKPKQKTAKCTFDYDAVNEDELTLKVGDIVVVTKQEDEGWWEGEFNGKHGVFPSNFVELIDDTAAAALPATPSAAAAATADAEQLGEDGLPIKAKKIQGIGLGNIFAGGAVQLKKTGNVERDMAGRVKEAGGGKRLCEQSSEHIAM